ncbi:MAG: CoA transferase [Actinomycetota bacterium]|nr:CoA transferase [Actinomycetota bacterium]
MSAEAAEVAAGPRGPLAGVKVVEFAQVIAGPLAGTLMADLGADVVHVEPPGRGDSARYMGPAKDGAHLWWKVLGRNKRSVTLDMRVEEGRAMAQRLVGWADVVIVTFRADTVEKYGLDWKSVQAVNPSAILLQISGYGARTSKRNFPGFGKMGEARSGLVHLTGFPDGPPVHTGFSHGDAATGLMGAFAVTAALHRRERDPQRKGEWIDLALSDTLFRLVEWQIILRDQLGYAPMRSGNQLAVAPAAVVNVFRSADGEWVTVTSGTPRSVSNIARLLGLDTLKYETQAAQAAGTQELDDGLREWIARHGTEECLRVMEEAGVVASKVFDVDDILADPIFRERESVVTVPDRDLGEVRMQGVVPTFVGDAGTVWRTGPVLGEDNDLVYGEWVGVEAAERARLAADGVI